MKETRLNGLKAFTNFCRTITLEKIIVFLKQFLIAVLAILLVLSFYPLPSSLKIVTVDITKLSENQLKKLSQEFVPAKDSKKAIQNYAQHLEQILAKLSKTEHWLILPKKAVIHGAEDFTEVVQTLLEEAME